MSMSCCMQLQKGSYLQCHSRVSLGFRPLECISHGDTRHLPCWVCRWYYYSDWCPKYATVQRWLKQFSWSMIMEKTDITLPAMWHISAIVKMHLGEGEAVVTKKVIKYFALCLGLKVTYWMQLQYTVEAIKRTTDLSKLIARAGTLP